MPESVMPESVMSQSVDGSVSEWEFPAGFVWGAATAAYQIEGSADADGRGRSIWDTFCSQPGRVHNGDNGDVACDHYRRVEEDLDLIGVLGLDAYRFSIAWPRIQPTGRGTVNQPGIDFYKRLLGGLQSRGISAVATLYHWDLPQPLADMGGWTNRDTSERFADYAAIVGEALGDGVKMWITLNEPWCSSWLSYGRGLHAPGQSDVGAAVSATHHLLYGHGLALAALRTTLGTDAKIGITLNLTRSTPSTEHPDDVAAARKSDGEKNRLFLDPIFKGAYPADMVEHFSDQSFDLASVPAEDLKAISAPIDFLGVNYYSPDRVASRQRSAEARAAGFCVSTPGPDPVNENLGVMNVALPDAQRTAMGWEIHPGSLSGLLEGLSRDYTDKPIYITENGAAFADYVGPNGAIEDQDRINYLKGHLGAVHDAIGRGVDVRGYFLWSLLDNFEWAFGYSRRFGIVWVDYPTGTRTPKASFDWYRAVIARNGLGEGTAPG